MPVTRADPWTAVNVTGHETGAVSGASSRNPFSGLGERAVHHFLAGMGVRGRYALLLGLCAGVGCDEETGSEELDPADVVVAERSNTSLKATVNLAHVANIYHSSDVSTLNLDAATLQTLAFLALNASLDHVYTIFGCTPMIETDDETFANATYLEATFVGCRTPFLELEGTARAEITVEVDEVTGKPTGVNWRVDGSDFSIHNPRQEFSPLFRGVVTLTTPIDGGAMKWQTGPTPEHPEDGFEIDLPIGRFDARSIASWTIDANECVTMDLEAQLTQLDMEDDLDEEIGDIVVSVKHLRQCKDRCPEDGEVDLAYGAGKILEWTYEADSFVDIRGPGGTSFEGALPCD